MNSLTQRNESTILNREVEIYSQKFYTRIIFSLIFGRKGLKFLKLNSSEKESLNSFFAIIRPTDGWDSPCFNEPVLSDFHCSATLSRCDFEGVTCAVTAVNIAGTLSGSFSVYCKTYGGDSYTISAVDENLGELYVTIARSDGTTDERWIEIMGDSMTVYTATKEDLLGNWVVDYSGEIFEITPYELGETEYQITRIEGNTIHFVTPDGWYTSGTATLSEGGSKIHVYLSHFNGNTSLDGRRERTERLPIVNG